jgi:hypothetical protein
VKGFEIKDKMSCKGVQKKNNLDIINYETYKKVLLENENAYVKNTGMRIFNDKQINKNDSDTNINRKIYTYEMKKIGLTQKYDKRVVLSDGISTVPLNI